MTNVFHDISLQQLDRVVDGTVQSLIISGEEGIGLTAAAHYVSDHLKAVPTVVLPEKNEKIDREHGVISVDSIRRLYDVTKTIATSPRVIIIDSAERMGHQAQNAFLKLLEEPTRNTHFILLTHTPSLLLPTIHSRAQHITMHPITAQQSETLLDSLSITSSAKRTQLLFIASGYPAEIQRLVADDDYFEDRAQIVRDARTLVQGTIYEKLNTTQRYHNDRAKSLSLLRDAMRMLEKSLSLQPTASTIKRMSSLLTIYERIVANGNIRLQLARAVL